MKFDNPIRVNNVAEEYDYVANQHCKCGGELEAVGQKFDEVPYPHDILFAKCEKCSAKRQFLFDVGSFFPRDYKGFLNDPPLSRNTKTW